MEKEIIGQERLDRYERIAKIKQEIEWAFLDRGKTDEGALRNELEKLEREEERENKIQHEKERLELIAKFERENPKPILWEEFNKKEIPEVSWRIKDLVPIEGFVTISSPSGEKKSWVALGIAKCISLGENFLGEEIFKTSQAKVLYLDAENPEREILRRGRQLSFQPTENLYIYHVNDINLNDDEKAQQLLDLIKKEEIKVVVIDTFRAVAGGLKEEKAEEIRIFFNRFKVLKDSGIVVIWLDHCRKRQNFESKDPKKEQVLGSMDKVGSVEILIMISSDTGSEEIRVFQRKNRLGIEIPAFKIIMSDTKDTEGNIKTVLKYGGEIEEQESKKEEAKELIMELLSDGNKKTTKEIIGIIGSEKKIGSKNIRTGLKELVDSGKIDYEKLGKQNLYRLVENISDSASDVELFDFDAKNTENSNFSDT